MEKLSFYFQKAKPYLKNKYLVICVVFGILAFGGVCKRISNSRKISKLKSEIAEYENKTALCRQQIEDSNKKNVQKIAREKYRMKQTNEDVFVEK